MKSLTKPFQHFSPARVTGTRCIIRGYRTSIAWFTIGRLGRYDRAEELKDKDAESFVFCVFLHDSNDSKDQV